MATDPPESMTCPHPDADRLQRFDAADYVSGDGFRIVQCRACGLSFTSPVPAPETLGRYYPEEYYGSLEGPRFPPIVERIQDFLYRGRVRRVERALGSRGGRVLDFGCGKGFLLRAFRQRGWQVDGVELSEQSARHGREVLGLSVQVGPIAGLPFPEETFDVVVLWHVFEHLPDPGEVLDGLKRLLRPGGILAIGVPNFGSLEARASKAGWFHLDVPRHLVHFSPGTLAAMVRKAGFDIVGWSWFAAEFDAFSFIQSVQNRMGLPMNLLYQTLRQPGSKLPLRRAHGWQRALTLALAVPLGMLALIAVPLAGLFRQGSSMTLFARRSGRTSDPQVGAGRART